MGEHLPAPMRRTARAGFVSLVTLALLGGPLWLLLPAAPVTVASYVPLVLGTAAVAGFLVVHADRLTERPRVTGPGAGERQRTRAGRRDRS